MKLNRRRFLVGTSAALVAARGSARAAQPSRPPIRLGAPVFLTSDDPGVRAAAHRELGYRAAYGPDIPLEDRALVEAYVREFARQDVVIAEVGAWVNMLDPDPVKRRENVDFVIRKLALAEELGARCCVDIAGSYHPAVWFGPHPQNFSRRFFEETVETVRRVIDAVAPRRTRFSIEMMGWALPSTPDQYLELIRAVDREAFAVHVDVCNMINSPEKTYNTTALIEECFRKLGPWVVSCHAKDVAWEIGMQVHFKEVIPGQGVLDYPAYLRELAALEADIPLMIEHLPGPEEYRLAADFIRGIARQAGIALGS